MIKIERIKCSVEMLGAINNVKIIAARRIIQAADPVLMCMDFVLKNDTNPTERHSCMVTLNTRS